jgi:Bax protein
MYHQSAYAMKKMRSFGFQMAGLTALLIPLLFACSGYPPQQEVKIEYCRIDSINDIQPITGHLVKPLLYERVVSLKNLPIEKQKQKFIDLMLPAILVAKYNLEQKRIRIAYLAERGRKQKSWSPEDSLFVQNELKRYEAKDLNQLDKKIKPHPVSLVLAQAALESGWGTSGFFVEANNVFGVWSFREDEDRIETTARRGNQKVYLRRYANLSLAVNDYYETLGRVAAYRRFRNQRLENDDPLLMLPQLHPYSELGKKYTRRLRAVIKDNRLTRFDAYQIDPDYIQASGTQLAAWF